MENFELVDLADMAVDMELFKKEFPYICNDVAMVVCRPFRLICDPAIDTAATDCKANIFLSLRFFTERFIRQAYGSVYHETGHILFSPEAGEVIAQAKNKGGEELAAIVNLLYDRKDDFLFARENPGFAMTLRRRLAYICLFARYYEWKERLAKKGMGNEEILKFLKNWKPYDAYEDFFFVVKWGKSPRLSVTTRALRHCRMRKLEKATPDEILSWAKKIRDILGKMPTIEKQSAIRRFVCLIQLCSTIERPDKLPPRLARLVATVAKAYVAMVRGDGLKQLEKLLKSARLSYPGPLMSVGLVDDVLVKPVHSHMFVKKTEGFSLFDNFPYNNN